MRPDLPLDRHAAGQHGLIVRAGALDTLSSSAVGRRLASARWETVHPGVYRILGAPRTRAQTLRAAALGAADSAVSHRAAAISWALDGVRGTIVEVTVPYARSPALEGVIVHRSLDLAARWVTTVDGVPTTTPARTLIDLGAVLPERVVHRAITNALGRRLVTVAELQSLVRELGKRGRRGTGALRRYLEARGGVDPAGIAEAEFLAVLADADIPQVTPEHEIRDATGRFVARVDAAVAPVRLAFEVNGYQWHGAVYERFQSDHVRRNAITLAGWELVEFTPTHVRRDPDYVRRTAEAAYRRASRSVL
jgi:hypothetical protein